MVCKQILKDYLHNGMRVQVGNHMKELRGIDVLIWHLERAFQKTGWREC